MQIVIIEDNRNLATSIVRVLKQEKFLVEYFRNGKAGYDFLTQNNNNIDLIILDIMLPDLNGLTICEELRKQSINIPILMLTAKTSIADKVEGLRTGADDYLTKPFSIDELLARIHALLRRPQIFKSEKIHLNKNLIFDADKRKVVRNQKEIQLTAKEFSILECLIRHKNTPVSQQKLFDNCFDFAKNHRSNSIEVHIKNLRKKLFKSHNENIIKTIREVGYCIEIK